MSAEHSSGLRLAMGYFTLTGGVTLIFGTIALVVGLARGVAAATPLAYAVGGATIIAMGLGALWTGRLLGARRRLGGGVAFVTLAAPVVQRGIGRGTAVGVLFSLLGAAVVASVLRELE